MDSQILKTKLWMEITTSKKTNWEWWKLLMNIMNPKNASKIPQIFLSALVVTDLLKEKVNYQILANKFKALQKKNFKIIKMFKMEKNIFKKAFNVKTKKLIAKEWRIFSNVNFYINYGQKNLNKLWQTQLSIIWRVAVKSEFFQNWLSSLSMFFLYF